MSIKNKNQEVAHIYRLNSFDNMELLSARYVHQRFPIHSHDTYCIGILEEGSQVLSISNNDFIVPANSVILINPNEAHANFALDEKGWKYKMMYVSSDILKYVSALHGESKYTNIRFDHHILQDKIAFRLIKAFFNLHEKTSYENLEQELANILTHLIFYHASDSKKREPFCHDSINDLKTLLNENFDTKIKLDHISSSLGMSKFKAIRTFKKSTGMTPFSYVLQKRIEKAKILIAQNVKLSHVALESGFYDQSHFSKYFKSYVGVTPISYFHSCNILQDFNKKSGEL